MDKADALKKAVEKIKYESEQEFQREVKSLMVDIGRKSNELRELKQRLTELTYTEPDYVDIEDFI